MLSGHAPQSVAWVTALTRTLLCPGLLVRHVASPASFPRQPLWAPPLRLVPNRAPRHVLPRRRSSGVPRGSPLAHTLVAPAGCCLGRPPSLPAVFWLPIVHCLRAALRRVLRRPRSWSGPSWGLCTSLARTTPSAAASAGSLRSRRRKGCRQGWQERQGQEVVRGLLQKRRRPHVYSLPRGGPHRPERAVYPLWQEGTHRESVHRGGDGAGGLPPKLRQTIGV